MPSRQNLIALADCILRDKLGLVGGVRAATRADPRNLLYCAQPGSVQGRPAVRSRFTGKFGDPNHSICVSWLTIVFRSRRSEVGRTRRVDLQRQLVGGP